MTTNVSILGTLDFILGGKNIKQPRPGFLIMAETALNEDSQEIKQAAEARIFNHGRGCA